MLILVHCEKESVYVMRRILLKELTDTTSLLVPFSYLKIKKTQEPHTSHNMHNILKNRFNFLISLFSSTLKTNISVKNRDLSQKNNKK